MAANCLPIILLRRVILLGPKVFQMPISHLQMIQSHFDLIESGQIAKAMLDYDFPLAMQVNETMIICPSAEAYAARLTDLLATMQGAGNGLPKLRIVAIELPRHGRFRVWIDWSVINADGTQTVANRSIFYCRMQQTKGPSQPLIEMLECNCEIENVASDVAARRYLA